MRALRGFGTLVVASVCFGSSAIFIRFATDASAFALAFYRLSIAAVGMTLYAALAREPRKLRRDELLLASLSGVVLSLHFATFIFAVQKTTVANATFLVNTGPIMLTIMSPVLIKERTGAREVVAVALATLGVIVLAQAGDGLWGFNLGDLSALLAAFFLALYSMAGRRLRSGGMSTVSYASSVYSVAAVVGLGISLTLGTETFRTYNAQNLAAILGLAVVPTMFGHTLYNYALGSVKTVTANIFPLMEPIIASLLAVVFFAEIPALIQVAGYSLILAGVIVVATSFK